MVFPEAARYLSESGKVLLKAVIEPDGKVTNLSIELSADAILDAEAMRVAKLLPNWIPAKFHNRPIRSVVSFDVEYKLVIDPQLEKGK